MTAYCTRADVYALGLPPEVFARPARSVGQVIPSSGTIVLRAHGLSTDAPISLSLLSTSSIPGSPAAALPGGLSAGVSYYVQPIGSDSFQLATTAGGTPIASFTDAGVGVLGILVDHGPYLDACIEDFARMIEAHLTAHRGPIVVSPVLTGINARGAADSYVGAHGAGNAILRQAYDQAGIARRRILDDRMLTAWLNGKPLPFGSVDATPTVAEGGAVAVRLISRGFFDDCEDNRV